MREHYLTSFMKNKLLLYILTGLLLLYVLINSSFLILSVKVRMTYRDLGVPNSFAQIFKAERYKFWEFNQTNTNMVQVRRYRVSANMEETKDIVYNLLQKYNDKRGDEEDDRFANHYLGQYSDLEILRKNCGPGQFPLKSGVIITVFFTETEKESRIRVDKYGAVMDLPRFEKAECSKDGSETFVTFAVFATP